MHTDSPLSVPPPAPVRRTDRGVIYVATGSIHLEEARQSLGFLRRSNPTLPAAIVTDTPQPAGDWDLVLPLPNPQHSLRDKLHMRRAPWPLALFVDTDTYVAHDLGEIFALLEAGFDLAAHQLFEGHDYTLPDVPDSFPEFNTGVVGFRNTPAVQRFFDEWDSIYAARPAPYSTDQYSFRIAVFHSTLRHTVLPPEYNFRPLSTNFAALPLRVVHGRPLAEMPALKQMIDVRLVHRAYVPSLDCVVSDHMTPAEIARLWLAVTGRALATVLRAGGYAIRRLVGRS